MIPVHQVQTEVCVCHSLKIKYPKGKHPRCRVTGSFCKTKKIKRYRPEGKKNAPVHVIYTSQKVSQITQKKMMPKMIDELFCESPIHRSIEVMRYRELSKELRELIHNASIWDVIWPWSRLNKLDREVEKLIGLGMEQRLIAENNAIRNARRRSAYRQSKQNAGGTLTKAQVARRYRSVSKS